MIHVAAARLLSQVATGGNRAFAALLLLGVVAATLAMPAATAQTAGLAVKQQQAATRAPLGVSIQTMTPSTLPRRGEVTLIGEITNRSRSTWTDLNVYLFVSSSPMTTSEELAEATSTDPALEVGARLTDAGQYDEVPDLAPGESTPYRVSVPRRDLPRASGVYWIGIHVLGTNEQGRLDGADGRARTFIAAMPDRRPTSTLSLVVPFRAQVRRDAEGRVANVDKWHRRLGEEGRLTRLLDLTSEAVDVPLTIVADPAVLAAARSLAEGNPEFDVSPTDRDAEESPGPDAPLSEEPEPVEEGAEDGTTDEVTEISPKAQRAADWLTGFTELTEEHALLALPYGDVDVATLLRGDFRATYERAAELSTLILDELGMAADPVVAPPDGLLPHAAVGGLDPDTLLLLSERAVDADATTVRLRQGSEAVLTSDVARIGGPKPTPPFDALALRQRILAEAAVHGLSGAPRPLVVTTPDLWQPGPDWESASFFEGLDVPWLRTVDVAFTRAVASIEEYDGRLAYPRGQRQDELPTANVHVTRRLSEVGTLLAELLSRNDTIDAQVSRAAMLGSSVHARDRPRRARVVTRQITAHLRRLLGSVSVESSTLVTMSSETGSFQVTVVNGLEEPVTVGLEAETDTDDLTVRSPDLISLGAGQRASVRLAVSSSGSGVHSVRITPTTRSGEPIGQSTTVALRSSQVGLVIWLIMGIGAAVFVAAIGARIVRRFRKRGAAVADAGEGTGA